MSKKEWTEAGNSVCITVIRKTTVVSIHVFRSPPFSIPWLSEVGGMPT